MTADAGRSLARTLYDLPCEILLSGELGAGKTTFLKGFARGLGIAEDVVSPTFALEQRYATRLHGELIHLDLFRLSQSQARELVFTTDDHEGIRCIEWPERLGEDLDALFPRSIRLQFEEEGTGRRLTTFFRDMPIPSSGEIGEWQEDMLLPGNILLHCAAVASFCSKLGDILQRKGTILRTKTLQRAGKAHDLLRFIDFGHGGAPKGRITTAEEERTWEQWRGKYAGMRHEEATDMFLREKGYASFGSIVAVHGLTLPSHLRATTEQKVLYYADKRVKEDEVVTLEERFRDFNARYGKAKEAEAKQWLAEAKALEKELFPEGAP